MYHSRRTLTNGLVYAALDSLTGEPLDISLCSTKENILKNNILREASPLKVVLKDGRSLRPPKYAEIRTDASLRPVMEVKQLERSAQAEIFCPALVDMKTGERVEIEARWSLSLPENDTRLRFFLTLNNHTEEVVEKTYFPYLNGIWMGEDWTEDTLYMPVHSGDKTVNPTETMSMTPAQIGWKWQEYHFPYTIGGPYGQKNAETGAYERECTYSGPCSMLYMELCNPTLNMGIYLTCRNDALRLKAIRAATYGRACPGMSLSMVHFPHLHGGTWQSEECVLALFEGDWHWGADDYRTWRQSVASPVIERKHRPDWFMESAGLVAHYDFKYQGGGIVHHFADIPALLTQAQEMGLNHLLLSGWNKDGFDNGFPMYTPDPDLGTEEELKAALKTVHERGGHVAFYINSRLCNVRYQELEAFWHDNALMHADGSLMTENYGADDLTFACMCAGAAPWQEKLMHTVDYLTNQIGADSMYLDQLGMADGLPCHNEGHAHGARTDAWNQGYEKTLAGIRKNYQEDGVALIYEGASDIHARGVSGQLISTMFFPGAMPELFKYTFPDDVLVDMMNPAWRSGMRPATVAQKSTFLLYRAFCVGSYFWVYDLEEDNSFRYDAEQYDRLKRVIALRTAWLKSYGHGIFKDTVGIEDLPKQSKAIVKHFEIENGMLLTCANEQKENISFVVRWDKEKLPLAFIRTFEQPEMERPITAESVPKGIRISTSSELCYIVLKNQD